MMGWTSHTRAVLVTLLLVALASCSDGAEPTATTLLPPPDVVVRDWLAAVAATDAAALAELVAPQSLAFVVGIESRLPPEDIVALADDGLPLDLVDGYWRSFASAFVAIDGTEVGDLAVGSSREFEAAGARYAAVTIGEGPRSTDVLVRRSTEGRWQVDVLATVGPGLTVQLLDLAERATEDRFRTLFEQWVMPAMEAAATGDGEGELVATVRQMRLVFDAAR